MRAFFSLRPDVRQVKVERLLGKQARRPHKLTPFAQVEGMRITYPSEAEGDAD
jgi:hypothetical protein